MNRPKTEKEFATDIKKYSSNKYIHMLKDKLKKVILISSFLGGWEKNVIKNAFMLIKQIQISPSTALDISGKIMA